MLQKVRMIMRKSLRLVGVGAMFIASKYEEIFALKMEDFYAFVIMLIRKMKYCEWKRPFCEHWTLVYHDHFHYIS